ncbi:chaperonin family protein RbcX [cyanobacterium endosymbiont of Epithemia turgida]|nr:chaperonin family protein RbcX [cyanobacterium endosymbiont of Epithemia turgida]
MAQNKELVLPIMSILWHLLKMALEFLPKMVMDGISQANMKHHRQL